MEKKIINNNPMNNLIMKNKKKQKKRIVLKKDTMESVPANFDKWRKNSKKINDFMKEIDKDDKDESKDEIETVINDMEKYKKKNHTKSTFNSPWIEKYRPRSIEDLVVDKPTFNKVEKIIHDKDMPNVIITGVPGIGKTTTILCIAKNLLGKYYNQGVLELNASDDRGIKAVQESIIYFCKKKLEIQDEEGRTYSRHKIVLLDEADNMTKKAQQLVNNLMSQYHNTTRFAFTCNNSSDIIEAIQSRCIIFRYRRLNNDQLHNKLKFICEKEMITYSNEGLDALVTIAQGDLRQAINNLQLTYNGYEKIVPENVYKLCDKPHPEIIKDIFMACYEKDIVLALENLEKLRIDGYSSSDISISMINLIKTSKIDEIDEKTKIDYYREISRTCLIISKGVNSPLQLTGCIAKMCLM